MTRTPIGGASLDAYSKAFEAKTKKISEEMTAVALARKLEAEGGAPAEKAVVEPSSTTARPKRIGFWDMFRSLGNLGL